MFFTELFMLKKSFVLSQKTVRFSIFCSPPQLCIPLSAATDRRMQEVGEALLLRKINKSYVLSQKPLGFPSFVSRPAFML